jgi:hypothetical protein
MSEPSNDGHAAVAWFGIKFGMTLAIVMSYVENESVILAIIHAWFSWFYVVWGMIFH